METGDENGAAKQFRDVTNTQDGASGINSATPVLDPKERKKMMDRERARARRAATSLQKKHNKIETVDENRAMNPFRDVTNCPDGVGRVSSTPVLDPTERKNMKDRERIRAKRTAMSLEKREEVNKKRRDLRIGKSMASGNSTTSSLAKNLSTQLSGENVGVSSKENFIISPHGDGEPILSSNLLGESNASMDSPRVINLILQYMSVWCNPKGKPICKSGVEMRNNLFIDLLAHERNGYRRFLPADVKHYLSRITERSIN